MKSGTTAHAVTYSLELPKCRLHVMEAGSGSPLIIVPATASELENWVDLVRFFGQWFRTYFFELPGHGQSTRLEGGFTSDAVSEVVEQLADRLGAKRFSLAGFSFGGILAMKVFQRLHPRIDRTILLSPCLTARALRLNVLQRAAAHQLNQLLKGRRAQQAAVAALRSRLGRDVAGWLISSLGNVENMTAFKRKLAGLQPSLIEILSAEVDEILHIEFVCPEIRHNTPCYFAMSVRDPILDYELTLKTLGDHFEDVRATPLSLPYHQPPKPFSLAELNENFRPFVEDGLAVESRFAATRADRRSRQKTKASSPAAPERTSG